MRIDNTGRECLYVTREHGVKADGAHLSKTTKGEAAEFGVVPGCLTLRCFRSAGGPSFARFLREGWGPRFRHNGLSRNRSFCMRR